MSAASLDREPPSGVVVAEYFDHNAPAYSTDRFAWFKELRKQGEPVVWSPHYGGFWVVLGWPELVEAAKDSQTFSSRGQLETAPDGGPASGGLGLHLPPRPKLVPMLEDDPAEWEPSRRALNPMFLPDAVKTWRKRLEVLADACIDRVIESGQIDLARDLGDILPVVFSLELVGVPTDSYRLLAEIYNVGSHIVPGEPRWDEIQQARADVATMVMHEVKRRGALPTGQRGRGVIAQLLDSRDAGSGLTDDRITGLALLVIGAGIDTTAATIGTSLLMISQDETLRQSLLRDPRKIGESFDEFLRLSTPTSGLVRTAMRDTQLAGKQIRRGDRVMLCFAGANRDDREFPAPDSLDTSRRPNRHVGFGSGIHRCLGAHFARLEFDVVVSAVLRRMPDFRIAPEATVKHTNIGIVDGWITIPAQFTPGPRLGVEPGVPGWDYSKNVEQQ